jgi:acetolactate synthase-1/3 small subunit
MAMRRGQHTSRVLKALGTSPNQPSPSAQDSAQDPDALPNDESLPNEFDD